MKVGSEPFVVSGHALRPELRKCRYLGKADSRTRRQNRQKSVPSSECFIMGAVSAYLDVFAPCFAFLEASADFPAYFRDPGHVRNTELATLGANKHDFLRFKVKLAHQSNGCFTGSG
ncbi:hypothetical protein PXK01_01725 [Phaeobacter sp. PT47_59]|uniref:hypothetical protein n=1 Tax=Phaeobacter sp. PT47_59 TaxID=3029979 RepID=UPI002380019A|nr:hypothetical protein [Phaeobacter sp. PT47_59]MDE4172849.1 hypothetical protein [Phaeobacter sp. PT47_59]